MTDSLPLGNKKAQQMQYPKLSTDSGERKKQQQSSSISRKLMTNSTERRHLNNQKTLECREFIRELVGETWIKVRVGRSNSQSKQTDLVISQGGVLSLTIFIVANNGILRKFENVVDGSLFADDLAIYITARNQRVVARARQGVTNKLDA